jgi:hypothetical protein
MELKQAIFELNDLHFQLAALYRKSSSDWELVRDYWVEIDLLESAWGNVGGWLSA